MEVAGPLGTPLGLVEWDPEIRVAPVEENSVLDTSLNEVFFVLPKPPASRALCQAKRAPRAAFPSV